MKASEVLARIPDSLSIYEREEVLWELLVAGHIDVEWVDVEVGDGLVITVMRDYLRWGEPGDSVRLGTTAFTQQRIADFFGWGVDGAKPKNTGAMLLTPKLEDACARAALEAGGLVGMFPQHVNARTSGYVRHSNAIDDALPEGYCGIVVGPKGWNISADAFGGRFVTNYGGFYERGEQAPAPLESSVSDYGIMVIQGPYEAHTIGEDIDGDGDADSGHADYSQFIRLAKKRAKLHGKPVELPELVMGKFGLELAALVNHEGRGLPGWRLPGVPELRADGAPVGGDPTPPRVTRLGEKGPDVRAWQTFLVKGGYLLDGKPLRIDGDHGPKTQTVTNLWRQEQGLGTSQPAPEVGPAPELLLLEDLVEWPPELHLAKHYGRGRPRGSINGVTIHVAQTAEVVTGAENLARYAHKMPDGREVSWNYAADSDSVSWSVPANDRAYAAGPGNDRDVHIEIVGSAFQTAAQWADDFSEAALEITAALTAYLLVEHDLPANKVDAFGLLSELPGVRGHDTWSAASVEARRRGLKQNPWWNPVKKVWRSTNHSDPGRFFPWAWFMERVRLHVAERKRRALLAA